MFGLSPTTSNRIGDLLAITVLLCLLIPTSLTAVAKGIGIDPHPIGFFIGPALYSYGNALIPNIDYFVQYGIGPGALFRYFLSDSVLDVFRASVLITLLGTAFFVATYYFLAKLTLQS